MNVNDIELGHGIYDHLPRGGDGEVLADAVRARMAALLESDRKSLVELAKARSVDGSISILELEAIVNGLRFH